ncbi:hypothetical protein CRG98_022989 [Punica granatum]|uniref:Uncharacterized protein n=1 Tax=Punica granatum TaxID=22663 RepID=A0A2I0JM58_PUNGR|nr:hypothetical protein CRG98_022989 [Punica granatum]
MADGTCSHESWVQRKNPPFASSDSGTAGYKEGDLGDIELKITTKDISRLPSISIFCILESSFGSGLAPRPHRLAHHCPRILHPLWSLLTLLSDRG